MCLNNTTVYTRMLRLVRRKGEVGQNCHHHNQGQQGLWKLTMVRASVVTGNMVTLKTHGQGHHGHPEGGLLVPLSAFNAVVHCPRWPPKAVC
eukprot:12009894-Heterocapsa_arctica.AAC.1